MATGDVKGYAVNGEGAFDEVVLGTYADNEFTPSGGGGGDLVDDTTPQLGGNLDLNSKYIKMTLVAGETLAAGNLCIMKSTGSGKMFLTDADLESLSDGLLGIALASASADDSIEFAVWGPVPVSSLTQAAKYFISTTPGAITATKPSDTGDFVRVLGYALTTSVLFFCPSPDYIEIK